MNIPLQLVWYSRFARLNPQMRLSRACQTSKSAGSRWGPLLGSLEEAGLRLINEQGVNTFSSSELIIS